MAPLFLLPPWPGAQTSTPMADSEQFYAAPNMRGVQLAMVRIPGV